MQAARRARLAIKAGKKQLSQLKNDAQDANDPKAQKYQELFQRDKEMSELIDTFEPTKASETAKIEKAQAECVRLLLAASRAGCLRPDSGVLELDPRILARDMGFYALAIIALLYCEWDRRECKSSPYGCSGDWDDAVGDEM